MNPLTHILAKLNKRTDAPALGPEYEYCPKCEANLTLQKGYRSDLSFWTCKGCGEMLINPELDTGSDIVWVCDNCGIMLNLQPGFNEDCGSFKCTECGYDNKISREEIYLNEDEFMVAHNSPYRGLTDEDALSLSMYTDEQPINGRDDITIVRNMEDDRLYVRKFLRTYDLSVYEYLKDNPIAHMPRIYEIFEGDNNLIVIEEYIQGKTLQEILLQGSMDKETAVRIIRDICKIARNLHNPDKPIIHRDIKPSNVIVSSGGEIYLLDMNVAKWYKPDEVEDTRLLGTQYYAAPEQLGYGFSASTDKSDIYALGMLLNVLVTGKLPKEERAPHDIFAIVERCICLEPRERFSDDELIEAIDSLLR